MSGTRVFVARLAGCGVFDPAGDRLGRVRDVLVVYRKDDPPRVVGLIAEAPGKRRFFVSIGRVSSISAGQVITTGPVSDHKFEQRGGEVRLIAEFLGRKVDFNDGSGIAEVEDVAIEETGPGEWAISPLYATALVLWSLVTEQHDAGEPQSAEALIASYSELRPADLANTLLDLPQERMLEVAEELSDDRLADVLEEMDESDQVEIMAQLDDERAADILDEMQPHCPTS
jgi:sporulation protein YlmC with PRC-barrel domain